MTDDASPPASARRPSLRQTNSGNGNVKAAATAADDDDGDTKPSATSTGISAPPGYAFRRAKTVAETNLGSGGRQPTSAKRLSAEFSYEPPPSRRRSSNFSDYSIQEAQSILNPHGNATAQGSADQPPESSTLAGLSLAFALLPAIAGALFKNGGAVTTDIMLLGLAGVFLHWSVTQPWLWYHSAQQIRINYEENAADEDMQDDSDAASYEDGASQFDHVPEDDTPGPNVDNIEPEKRSTTPQQQSALTELYLHEVTALLSCFSLPIISAYILHMIRAQLSRPSEGLVSNYNLTIFILVAEVRVLSHIIKLVQARTLHLQRIVHSNPYGTLPTTNSLRINAILERLDALESDSVTRNVVVPEEDEEDPESVKAAQEAVLTKDVRNAIQPELDALNRAVRRYEKKSTLLQSHVDAHFAAMDARVEDAIALAAVAAKNSARSSILVRGFDAVVKIVLFPFNAVVRLLMMPVIWLVSWTKRGTKNKKSASSNGSVRGGAKLSARGSRGSKTVAGAGPPRYNGDKVPSRLSRK